MDPLRCVSDNLSTKAEREATEKAVTLGVGRIGPDVRAYEVAQGANDVWEIRIELLVPGKHSPLVVSIDGTEGGGTGHTPGWIEKRVSEELELRGLTPRSVRIPNQRHATWKDREKFLAVECEKCHSLVHTPLPIKTELAEVFCCGSSGHRVYFHRVHF
jgi:hypothetical protein